MIFLLFACTSAPKDLSAYTHPEAGEAAPDFILPDVNATSASYDLDVSVSDREGNVSAWYFGHAT